MGRSNCFGFNLDGLFPNQKTLMYIIIGIIILGLILYLCKTIGPKSKFQENFGEEKVMTHAEATAYALKYTMMPDAEKALPINVNLWKQASDVLAVELHNRKQEMAGAPVSAGEPPAKSLTASLKAAAPAAVVKAVQIKKLFSGLKSFKGKKF